MRNTIKVLFVFLSLSLLIIKPTASYAWYGGGGWHGGGWHDHGYVGVSIGVWPGTYYYGDPYYYPYYASPYYAPAYVAVSSPTYQPVVINGVTYYVNNGVYYIYTQYGYQAVATPTGAAGAPVVASSPVSADTNDSFTINVPNNKGGYTAVVIKRSGNGFVGPQGEFYTDFPKISQLQTMYGK